MEFDLGPTDGVASIWGCGSGDLGDAGEDVREQAARHTSSLSRIGGGLDLREKRMRIAEQNV